MPLSGNRDTHAPLTAPCTVLFLCASAAAVPLEQVQANQLFGIDERPSNTTCVAAPRPVVQTSVALQRVFPNLSFITLPDVDDQDYRNGPIDFAQAPGDSGHWFVAEHGGRILRFENDDLVSELDIVLDITDRFLDEDYSQQWGIQSIAFHPEFQQNGELFIVYNSDDGPGTNLVSYVSRFVSVDGGLSFDAAGEQIVLSFVQDAPWHQFGDVAFGPDGYLYVSTGDGGTNGTSQDVNDLRGKMLRLDVDGGTPYAIPPTNPFAAGGGAPEVYAWGLRNPWRFSLDLETGDLWLGDVGASSREEVNLIERAGNYGWKEVEGTICFRSGCDLNLYDAPVIDYDHSLGTSVTGGYVYRGSSIPGLFGTYLFGDAGSGRNIWAIKYDQLGEPFMEIQVPGSIRISGFAQDLANELYAFDVRKDELFKLVPSGQQNGAGSAFPGLLSETGCFNPENPAEPSPSLIPYDIAAPLWSDGAEKNRWMAIPDGEVVTVNADGDFDFPIGTVLVKEFRLLGDPVETRLMMLHDDGLWTGYSYEWNEDLSDAVLLSAAKQKDIAPGVTWRSTTVAEICGRSRDDSRASTTAGKAMVG